MADTTLPYARRGAIRPRFFRLLVLLLLAVLGTYVLTYGLLRATHVIMWGTGREVPNERVNADSAIIDFIFRPPEKLEEMHKRSIWEPHL